MEELLNKLIKKGWKPFGWDDKLSSLHKEFGVGKRYIRFHNGMDSELFDLRQLTSKESGIWQFVCENKMVDDGVEYKGYALVDVDGGAIAKYETGCRYLYSNIEPEFYIMESALCNEEDLEKFLLDNIKVS